MTDTQSLLDYPLPRVDPLLPPPAYTELRNGPPRLVRLAGGRRAWLVSRYEDVRSAIADPRVSSDDMAPNFPALIPLPPTPRALSMFRLDNPDHASLRRMVIPEFTARATRALQPDVERITNELLDALVAGPKPADLMASFADPLPTLVIARLLGVPYEDHELFQENGRIVTSPDATPEEAGQAFVVLTEFMGRLIETKRKDPQDDLISRLCVKYLEPGEISFDDLLAMARFLLFAGHDTTANQIAMSVLYLLDNPDQLALLRSDRSLIPSAVEELLRIASIKQHDFIRTASEDLEIAGVTIAKGEGIIFALPSANHDETVFPDPGRLDITRDAHHHMAFGHGIHKCVGAPLATLELETAIGALLDRFPDLQLSTEVKDIPYRDDMLLYGAHKLLVTW
ncbi:cytochrome P450 [Kitasatospora sp. MAP12-15]|uniref:cytochrome P450 n=1 Tax=unclassified Kitasatospora TaxID=2633591 RepID=UPI00247383FF|nr:cytochrome P450 [Kitasatospora sp. MAP12-44]MDH6110595.1 cytochrome P450 [Kitasatospora sp. MAP12-44]